MIQRLPVALTSEDLLNEIKLYNLCIEKNKLLKQYITT